MIEAAGTTDAIRRAYDLWSYIYDWVAGPLEHSPRLRALELSRIEPQDTVLEAGVGTGAVFLEILKRVNRRNLVCGIDLSERMLERTKQRIEGELHDNAELFRADVRWLPFQAQTFSVVYSSYVLDLLELEGIPRALAEFWRVLRPGGRLVLVNLSKENGDTLSFMEYIYQWLPGSWVPYLLGSCRPVFLKALLDAQGFSDVERQFARHLTHSEIVTARKPLLSDLERAS